MTVSKPAPAIQYSEKTLRRAERALRCSPFHPQLLAAMRTHSVALRQLLYDRGMVGGYTRRPLSELGADAELTWLITAGLLRREVDGQGLTDSFRLTPLGRQLLDRLESSGRPDSSASLKDHIYNALSRWLRPPGWLQ